MTQVTFICKRSGNKVSFSNENDIAGLRKHEGYTEELQDAQATETLQTESHQAAPKEVLTLKRGRPAKIQVPSFLQQ
jgi:hypothetical protein